MEPNGIACMQKNIPERLLLSYFILFTAHKKIHHVESWMAADICRKSRIINQLEKKRDWRGESELKIHLEFPSPPPALFNRSCPRGQRGA